MSANPSELAPLLLALGRAGIELAPHPTDPARLRHRPATLPPDLSDGLGMPTHPGSAAWRVAVGEGLDISPIMAYTWSNPMDKAARQALSTIRRCIGADRVRLTRHFRVRLAERGVLWGDVLSVFDAPSAVRADGFDDAGQARWIVRGKAADGTPIVMVCAIGRDARGELTVFITVYWEDRP